MISTTIFFLGKHCTLQVKTLPRFETHWKGLGKAPQILLLTKEVRCLQHPYEWEQVAFLSFSTSYFLKNTPKYTDIL